MPVAAFAFWLANRLMPPSDSLTWWQWFSGRNFLQQMIGSAVVFGVSSVVLLFVGEYWWAVGNGWIDVCGIHPLGPLETASTRSPCRRTLTGPAPFSQASFPNTHMECGLSSAQE